LERTREIGCDSDDRDMGEEKGRGRMRDRLSDGYDWKIQEAKRKNKKGKAIGGMILGIRKDLIVKEEIESVEGWGK